MPEYRHKKQYSGKKLAESKTSSLVADYINLSSHGRICFANLHLKDLTERCYGFNCIINPQQVFFESLISFCKRKTRYSIEYLVPLGRGIRIRTLNDGVRGSQSFFKTAYLSHFSDFASLKNLSEFYFCLKQQIRMRNCELYTEVSIKCNIYLLSNTP